MRPPKPTGHASDHGGHGWSKRTIPRRVGVLRSSSLVPWTWFSTQKVQRMHLTQLQKSLRSASTHPPHLPPPATHTTMTNQPDLTFASFVLVLDAEATGSQERRRLVPAGVGGTRARADPSSIGGLGGLGELRIYSPCASSQPHHSRALISQSA